MNLFRPTISSMHHLIIIHYLLHQMCLKFKLTMLKLHLLSIRTGAIFQETILKWITTITPSLIATTTIEEAIVVEISTTTTISQNLFLVKYVRIQDIKQLNAQIERIQVSKVEFHLQNLLCVPTSLPFLLLHGWLTLVPAFTWQKCPKYVESSTIHKS